MNKFNNFSINKVVELLLLNNKKSNYLFSRNTLIINNTDNLRINTTGLYFIDNSNILTQKYKIQNIFYSMFIIGNYSKFNLYLLNCTKIKSISNKVQVMDWYERELLEHCSIKIERMCDTRNLLFNYNLKTVNNSLLTKNRYNWVFTDVIKKKLRSSNNFRIVL